MNMLRQFAREFQDFLVSSNKLLHQMYGMDEDEDENVVVKKEQVKKKAPLYEDKYLERYKQLPSTSTSIAPNKNSFVIENTPIGNVVMMYDASKESFVYYSDHIVPFRYLETVSMRYVCVFNCKQVYVERHEEIIPVNVNQPKTTKDILNQARNPIPVKKDKIEVKMNRYSNAGRFSNFNILQPVARHITDKKQLLKFSDFKSSFNKGCAAKIIL